MTRISERLWGTILLMGLLFTALNFDPDVSIIFIIITIIGILLFLIDKKPEIIFERKPNKLKSIGIAFAGAFAVYIISAFVLNFFGVVEGGLFSIVDFFAQVQKPILSGNPYLILIVWGIFIPLAETTLIARFLEFLKDQFKVRLSLREPKIWASIVLVSALFMYYHLQAKSIAGPELLQQSLASVFIMGVVSLVLIVIFKQIIEASLMHIILNSTAVVIAYGLFPMVAFPLLIGGGIAFMLIILKEVFKVRFVTS